MNNLETYSNVDVSPVEVAPKNYKTSEKTFVQKVKTFFDEKFDTPYVDKRVDILWKFFRGSKKPWVEYSSPFLSPNTKTIKMIKNWTEYKIVQSISHDKIKYKILIMDKERYFHYRSYLIHMGVNESASLGEQWYLIVWERTNNHHAPLRRLPIEKAKEIVKKYIDPLK